MVEKIEKGPLGWLIVLLFIVLNAGEVLTEDIDMQLEAMFGKNGGFDPKKKQYLKYYFAEMKKARHWLDEMFGIDQIVWESTDKDSRRYSNAIADSNEIIRVLMYYLDRGHTPGGYDTIVHFLRSLPEQGVFSQRYIDRFQMDREWIYAPGDRVRTENHGDCTLSFKTNGDNWVVKKEDGQEVVLSESQFSII